MEGRYRFKRKTLQIAFFEGFDDVKETRKRVEIFTSPRSPVTFHQEGWTLHGKKAPATEGTIDLPFELVFIDRLGNHSYYPVVNNYGVSDYDPIHTDGVYLRLPIGINIDVHKLYYKIRFKVSGHSAIFSTGVNMSGGSFWIQVQLSTYGELTATVKVWTNDNPVTEMATIMKDNWYELSISIDYQYVTFELNTGEKVVLDNYLEDLKIDNIWLDGTTYSYVDGFFDYVLLQLNTDVKETDYLYVVRGNGFARRLLPKNGYVLDAVIDEATAISYEFQCRTDYYTKFSTKGFSITADGTVLKINSTDTPERTMNLDDSVWYKIKAVFYTIAGSYAMKVEVYLNDERIYEFNPMYSTVENPFDNPRFTTIEGKFGLIDNVEVLR